MENDVKQENSVSLRDILKAFWKYKIPFIISFVVVFVLIMVGVKCIYGPKKAFYEANFRYSGTLGEEKTQTYLDGSKFDYFEIVSADNINKIINSNSMFLTIDKEQLSAAGGITITKNTITSDSNSTRKFEANEYIIRMAKNAFVNGDQAKKFVLALVELPIEYNKSVLTRNTYDTFMKDYNEAKTYDMKIEALIKQITLLTNEFDKQIELREDESFYLDDVKYTSSQLKDKFDLAMKKINIEAYKYEVFEKGYVFDFEYEKTKLSNEKDAVDAEIEYLTLMLEKMNESYTEYSEEKQETIIELIDAKHYKDGITNKLAVIETGDETSSIAFGVKLEKMANEIENYANTVSEMNKELYLNKEMVYNTNSNVVSVTGIPGTLKTGLVALLGGLAIGTCAVWGASLIQKRKKED